MNSAVKSLGLFSNAPRGWIISRGQDLIWLQGSVLAGIGLMILFLSLPGLNSANYGAAHPAVILLLIWGATLDGPHVFATYARTYFAPDEKSKAGLPSNFAWSWLLLGPSVAVLDHFLFTPSPSVVGSSGILFKCFLSFAFLWAYYHLIRQHYGIMMLYRRKESVKDDSNLDTWFLWMASLYPFLRFGLSQRFISSGLPQLVPDNLLVFARSGLDIAFVLAMGAWLGLWLANRKMNPRPLGPKHMFLLIVVVFHFLVFAFLTNLLVIAAVLTIFHDLQYHRIVFLYEKGNNRLPMQSVFRYVTLGALFGLSWYGLRLMGAAVASSFLLCNILLGLGWCVAFHHYYVDARIWRVRHTPNVASSLDRGATT